MVDRLLLAGLMVLAAIPLPGLPGALFGALWLGLVPGLAVVRWLEPGLGRGLSWTLALAVAPVASTTVAWALMSAGLPIRTAAFAVALAAVVAFGIAPARPPAAAAAARLPRAGVIAGLALAAVLFVLPWLNPYLLIRGDGWIHGGIVMELLERGFPPQDARMAGLPLNYVWFFNFFVALETALTGRDPFAFMAALNVASGFALVALATLAAARLSADPRVPAAAAALVTLGLNAGAFLLWPLHLLKAFSGEVRGLADVMLQLHTIEFGSARILYSLHAPYSHMVSFFDKLLVGNALGFAYLQMTLFLWALLRGLDDGRAASWVWVTMGAAGMLLFHSVVGLSVLPVALAALGLAWLAAGRVRGMPARPRLAAAAGAGLAALLLTAPYLRSITSGWAPERAGFEHHFLQFGPVMPWTLLTACAFALAFLPGPLREAWRERRPLVLWLALYVLGMAVFACLVHMPSDNEVKFVFQCFAPAAWIAAPAFGAFMVRTWRHRRPLGVALAGLFVIPVTLTLHGYAVDASGNTSALLAEHPGEAALYDWMRHETPVRAVLVDRDFRDAIAVRGRRRLFLGTDQPPGLAAFPAPEMRRRQHVMADLYGPFAEPDSTVAGLLRPGGPTYVVFRPEDPAPVPEPWRRLLEAAPGSEEVYARDGYHVVRLATEGGA